MKIVIAKNKYHPIYSKGNRNLQKKKNGRYEGNGYGALVRRSSSSDGESL